MAKKILGILLALSLVIGLSPMFSVSVGAAPTKTDLIPYTTFDNGTSDYDSSSYTIVNSTFRQESGNSSGQIISTSIVNNSGNNALSVGYTITSGSTAVYSKIIRLFGTPISSLSNQVPYQIVTKARIALTNVIGTKEVSTVPWYAEVALCGGSSGNETGFRLARVCQTYNTSTSAPNPTQYVTVIDSANTAYGNILTATQDVPNIVPGAWVDIVAVINVTQASGTAALTYYINGVKYTAALPSLNYTNGIDRLTALRLSVGAATNSATDGVTALFDDVECYYVAGGTPAFNETSITDGNGNAPTAVAADGNVIVNFSNELNFDSFADSSNPGNSLININGSEVALSRLQITPDQKGIIISPPAGGYTAGSINTVTIGSGPTDVFGNALSNTNVSFTVADTVSTATPTSTTVSNPTPTPSMTDLISYCSFDNGTADFDPNSYAIGNDKWRPDTANGNGQIKTNQIVTNPDGNKALSVGYTSTGTASTSKIVRSFPGAAPLSSIAGSAPYQLVIKARVALTSVSGTKENTSVPWYAEVALDGSNGGTANETGFRLIRLCQVYNTTISAPDTTQYITFSSSYYNQPGGTTQDVTGITPGSWVNVVMVINVSQASGTAALTYYINGKKYNGPALTYTGGLDKITGVRLSVGAATGSSPNDGVTAQFDDVQVYYEVGTIAFTVQSLTDSNGNAPTSLNTNGNLILNFSTEININAFAADSTKLSNTDNSVISINSIPVVLGSLQITPNQKGIIILPPSGAGYVPGVTYSLAISNAGVVNVLGTPLTAPSNSYFFTITSPPYPIYVAFDSFSPTALGNSAGDVTANFKGLNTSGADKTVTIILAECVGTASKYMVKKIVKTDVLLTNGQLQQPLSASISVSAGSFVRAFVWDMSNLKPIMLSPQTLY